jgi:hypothetical protein
MNRAMKLLFAAALCVAACDKSTPETKPEDPASKNATTTGASAAVPTTAATPVATPPVIVDSDLATPADFEEAAEKAISKANYKTELAVIEAEIAKE